MTHSEGRFNVFNVLLYNLIFQDLGFEFGQNWIRSNEILRRKSIQFSQHHSPLTHQSYLTGFGVLVTTIRLSVCAENYATLLLILDYPHS